MSVLWCARSLLVSSAFNQATAFFSVLLSSYRRLFQNAVVYSAETVTRGLIPLARPSQLSQYVASCQSEASWAQQTVG